MAQRLIGVAMGLAAGAGIGGFGGAVFETAEHMPALSQSSQEVEQDLQKRRGTEVEASTNLTSVEQSIGETCLSTLKPYYAGNLHGVDYGVVIDDVMAHPDKPCGEVPTDIRVNITDLRSAHDSVVSAASFVRSTESRLESTMKWEQWSINPVSIYVGAAVGAAVGGAMGALSLPGARRPEENNSADPASPIA